MSKVLIIDDDKAVCRLLSSMVQQQGLEALSAATLEEACAVLDKTPIDLVLLDVHLPDGNGLEQISRIAQATCKPEIVIMTAQGQPDGAELAIQSGAWDYIEKPTRPKTLSLKIARVLEYRANKPKPTSLPTLDRQGIVGRSHALDQVLEQMAKTVDSDAGVLITGETGTGKELFAQAIHRNSTRHHQNFVVVDCAALPKTLVESMLFGHVKGAYTGAEAPRQGLIAQADGGTLFLDEVGEMPLDVQKSFLRVLESKHFRPIGDKTECHSNFRIIASTNQHLDNMVEAGEFRKDLLYRMRTFHLQLPSLRQRREDIVEIVNYHLHRLNHLYGWAPKTVANEFWELLQLYDWPGNVRELVNAVEHALAAARGAPALWDYHLPVRIRAKVARKRLDRPTPKIRSSQKANIAQAPFPPLHDFREQAVEQAEADYLTSLMSATAGNVNKACSLSGVSRSRFYELLKKHAIRNG